MMRPAMSSMTSVHALLKKTIRYAIQIRPFANICLLPYSSCAGQHTGEQASLSIAAKASEVLDHPRSRELADGTATSRRRQDHPAADADHLAGDVIGEVGRQELHDHGTDGHDGARDDGVHPDAVRAQVDVLIIRSYAKDPEP